MLRKHLKWSELGCFCWKKLFPDISGSLQKVTLKKDFDIEMYSLKNESFQQCYVAI